MARDLLRIGTRGSRLALIQTRAVIDALHIHWPRLAFQERIIRTTGDAVTTTPLSMMDTTGVFTKEIESALLRREIDIAVHSAKDVPTTLPEGLRLEIALPREDPRDALVAQAGLGTGEAGGADALPPGAVVGTSSERRRAQLLYHRPDLRVVPLRGNLDTRLRKLEAENLDAIVVAVAGLSRMGLLSSGMAGGARVLPLPMDVCMPAAGQGALAIELRGSDDSASELVPPLRDEATAAAVAAERAALGALGSGCRVAAGLHACVVAGTLRLAGVVVGPMGTTPIWAESSGQAGAAEEIGIAVARQLLDRGAGELLARARGGGDVQD
jgi:hydroxymethylbilane synthase